MHCYIKACIADPEFVYAYKRKDIRTLIGTLQGCGCF